MSLSRTLLLGLIAGGTIVLGLPIGRIRRPAQNLRVVLNAVAIGVLLFLFWDVLSAAWEPIDGALAAFHDGSGDLWPAAGYGSLFAAGLAVGLLGLVGYEIWMRRKKSVAGETARRLAFLIATGIGLHNFAEGLAIGQAAASGAIALATLLVIGFGLHNATEGFGIVAPLAAEPEATLPSWRLLGLLGLIGGGPTFLGAALGHGFTSEPVSVVFLTLAAGSILYVIMQLIVVAARSRRADLLACGALLGLFAGFLTDAVVTAAGV
jgi:ZIP family zinc transporter